METIDRQTKGKKMGVVTWRTHKTETGFDYAVIEIAYKTPTKTLKTGTLPTRARAVTKAKAWVRFFKAQA